MGAIINSSKVSLEFKPWTDEYYRVTKLQIIEQLGGEIPKGEIDLFLKSGDEAEKMVTEQNTGTLSIVDEKEEGQSYEIEIYVTDRNFYKNVLNLKFVCINNLEFFTKRITTYHQGGIKSAIESLYPGKNKNIMIESSLSNDIILYQNCETNYEMCRKLCYAYKDKSVFAFGWGGLLLKDLDKNKDGEELRKLESSRLAAQTETYNLKYDKYVNSHSFLAWDNQDESTTGDKDYAEFVSKNAKVVMNYQKYRVMGLDYYMMIDNAWNNQNLMRSDGYSSIKIVSTDIPHYELGEVVEYKRSDEDEKIPWKKYLVRSNELFYSIDANNEMDENGLRFSWTSYLYGLEEGEWSKDPEP